MFYNMYMILGVLALLSIGCSQGVVSTKQSKVDNIMNVFILGSFFCQTPSASACCDERILPSTFARSHFL